MENALAKLAEHAPAVAILIWLVIYFKGQIKIKDDYIKELNLVLRDMQKDTLTVLKEIPM